MDDNGENLEKGLIGRILNDSDKYYEIMEHAQGPASSFTYKLFERRFSHWPHVTEMENLRPMKRTTEEIG